MFRDSDGTGLRQFKVVSSNTYLTTARRITLTFMWIHALGTKATMLPAPCRVPALVGLSHLQIILLACHGRRSYSYDEWRRLLITPAMVFFDALQFLMQYKEDHDTSANSRAFTPVQRGYSNHTEVETDSDGDGGPQRKLQGRGHIEFSGKGIPHGILHFPMQLREAGHIYMHDTCAPEASHRYNIKTAMDRVKKGTDSQTASWLISWTFRVRTWAKIIDSVEEDYVRNTRTRKNPSVTEIQFADRHLLQPHDNMRQQLHHGTFSPLRSGKDSLLCNDARLSYMELAELVTKFTGWEPERVLGEVKVQLYCSANVRHTSGETRTYWATESQYQHNEGCRRDKVEIDLGQNKLGVAQITSFVKVSGIDGHVLNGVLIRWLDKSPRSTQTDEFDRPLCDFPLSFNHCLWRWSDAGRTRASFRVRGFRIKVARQHLWSHVPQDIRQSVIDSESRARYDIVDFTSIKRHVNIFDDPSTGDMLQTVQIL